MRGGSSSLPGRIRKPRSGGAFALLKRSWPIEGLALSLLAHCGISPTHRGRARVAFVDHARAECPGLHQGQRDVLSDRRQEGRAATDDDRIAEHAQLVDEAELDRRRGQAGAADRDVLVGRVERRSGLLGHRRLGEPGVALNAVERAAEDDLRGSAPGVGERGPKLVVAHRGIRLPRQHRLVKAAAAQIAAELAYLRCVETKLLLARDRPPDREGAFGWTVPDEEQFRFHTAQTRELGGYLCGRRLYETMLVWETDPSMRDNELGAAFADVWCAIPKVVFSRTLDSVQGNARLAQASVAEA